jgi:hypothetical protein
MSTWRCAGASMAASSRCAGSWVTAARRWSRRGGPDDAEGATWPAAPGARRAAASRLSPRPPAVRLARAPPPLRRSPSHHPTPRASVHLTTQIYLGSRMFIISADPELSRKALYKLLNHNVGPQLGAASEINQQGLFQARCAGRAAAERRGRRGFVALETSNCSLETPQTHPPTHPTLNPLPGTTSGAPSASRGSPPSPPPRSRATPR